MAYEIRIDGFLPTENALPKHGVDSVSGLAYSEWELNDEGRFTFVVPTDYSSGSDLQLRIQESTPGAAVNHKWQATVLLVKTGYQTDLATEQEVFSSEYTSSGTADALTSRTLSLSSSGQISGTSIEAGDTISVVLKRVSASTNEDPNAIKVFDLTAMVTVLAGTGTCSGRVGQIIEDVRILFNDETSGFLTSDTAIIRWINQGIADIAKAGYWETRGTLNLVADQASYDLASEWGDFVDVKQVIWTETGEPLQLCAGRGKFDELHAAIETGTRPYFYYMAGSTLYVTPTPTEAVTDGLTIERYYVPTDLDCSTNYTPDFPAVYDSVLVYWCLIQAFDRDRTATNRRELIQEYYQRYQQEKAKLLGRKSGPIIRLGCYRNG
jgi:hypothetical protein